MAHGGRLKMKQKPQLLIGGILLILGGLLTTFTTYYTAQNVVNEITTFSVEIIPWLIANLTYTLIVLSALIGGLLAILRQRIFAMILGGTALLFWIISALAWLIAQTRDGGTEFLRALKNVTIGWEGEKFTITLGGLPAFLILTVGVVLIFISKSSHPATDFGGFSGARIVQVDSTLPVVGGMKPCPECAEMIQANAIKCRFCDYRYQ